MLQSIPRNVRAHHFLTSRFSSTSSPSLSSAREFKVVLDNQTLYIEQPLAEALGWTHQSGIEGVKLTLRGWEPKFFAIAPSGTDSERLARATVESGHDPSVQTVLKMLKDHDASSD